MFDLLKNQLEQGIFSHPASLVVFIIIVCFFLGMLLLRRRRLGKAGKEEFTQLLSDAGYEFDESQGIFYSKINAWQKKYGYCRLYDEAAVPTGMILDSEPVRFEYGGKRWLIQFWKGQYYLNTGCEIGIYCTEEPDLDVPGFKGTFYHSVNSDEWIDMSFHLSQNGKELFQRSARHWWLTGFKPGNFSEPEELSMQIRLTFRYSGMCRSFVRAMHGIGYHEYEIVTDGVSAVFVFKKPRSPQPVTRTEETDWLIQRNNERVCSRFMEITGPYDDWTDKLNAIRREEPFLYDAVINIGKTRQIMRAFENLKKYL